MSNDDKISSAEEGDDTQSAGALAQADVRFLQQFRR